MPKGFYKPLTKQDEKYIFDNYLKIPIKRLAGNIGITGGRVMRFLKKHELTIPKKIIERNKRLGYYKKGSVPANKGKNQTEYMSAEAIAKTKATRFKKGNTPHNTNYDGHERISKDGYIEIRISKGNYKLKHLYNWELKNGKLPIGHCLACIDGDKKNTSPDNWELITRVENMYRNSSQNYPKEVIPSMVLVNKIKNKLNTLQDG